MREVTAERFVAATGSELDRALSPRAVLEYEGTFAVEGIEETEEGWTVSASAPGMTVTFDFAPRERGIHYEQRGEAGPFDEMWTSLSWTRENEGVRVTAHSGVSLGLPLATLAAVTILVSSVIALRQDNLKRRLAYSTISQLSYIVLGLGLLSPAALAGGLLHIPAHAFMKLTLFFCAGAIHVETHTDDISDMAGIGRRMPLTMAAFGVASLGMAGLPLLAGFVSKWYLLIGSVGSGNAIFAVVLLTSGLLNIGYFWPIVYQAFFQTAEDSDAKPLVEFPIGGARVRTDGGERAEDRDDDAEEAAGEPEAAEAAAGAGDVPIDTAEPVDPEIDPDVTPSEEEGDVEIDARIEWETQYIEH